MDPLENSLQQSTPPITPPEYRPPSNNTQPVSAPAAAPLTPIPGQDDPGKVLGIIGIILAFFVSIVGLVISIISRKRSINAGFSGTLGTVGIVLNSVFTAIGVLVFGFFVFVILIAYQSLNEKAKEASSRSQQYEQSRTATDPRPIAASVAKKAEAFYALKGTYPTTLGDFDTYPETVITEDERKSISTAPVTRATSEDIALYTCDNGTGFVVELWSADGSNRTDGYKLGSAAVNDQTNCTILSNTAPKITAPQNPQT